MVFRFGDFEVDEERFELRRAGRRVDVQPRVLDVILLLIRGDGRLVTKDDLIAGPWKGAAVSDGALNQAIMLARRVLTSGGASHAIVTVRGRGFRFFTDVIDVRQRDAPTGDKVDRGGEQPAEVPPTSVVVLGWPVARA